VEIALLQVLLDEPDNAARGRRKTWNRSIATWRTEQNLTPRILFPATVPFWINLKPLRNGTKRMQIVPFRSAYYYSV